MKYLNLIRKIAWSFHHTSGLEWDDLFSEATYQYCRALQTFDHTRGVKFSTYLWTFLTNALILYLDKENKSKTVSIDDTELMYQPANNPIPFWEELSEDAQQIADLIIHNSMEFVCLIPEDIEMLINYIFKSKGWSQSRIQTALADLKRACNN